MTRKITATEAARNFSDLLGSIKYQGMRYTILRGGKPVAVLAPAESVRSPRALSELTELLKLIPSLGKEAEAFELDLNRLAAGQPPLPSGTPWE
jgi:prevent-host-death family protein